MNSLTTVTLFGAGKIGIAIAALLSLSGRYRVRVCDPNLSAARAISSRWKNCEAHSLDLANKPGCAKLLEGSAAVVSALPFFCNVEVARLAVQHNVHYLDLTEDVQTTKSVMALAENASCALMPQCGLAPGFISVAAADLARSFERIDTIKMRVGALPIYPSNRLKYNLTWSTDGLINEYCNMCEGIVDGELRSTFPLEGYEIFSLDGEEYEAFNTSGGLGTLCDTFKGRVRNLDYRTIRHVGHRDLMAFLLHDLRFYDDRADLKRIFERSIPSTPQDKCIVFVEVRGWNGEHFAQKTYASKLYHKVLDGFHLSAIQLTTAAGICAPLDLLLHKKLPRFKGFVRCEEIALSLFLENEFGAHYRDENALRDLQ